MSLWGNFDPLLTDLFCLFVCLFKIKAVCCAVLSHSVVSDSLRPQGL